MLSDHFRWNCSLLLRLDPSSGLYRNLDNQFDIRHMLTKGNLLDQLDRDRR